jgi:glycosyltransferase involved in cell wall biosynthesis
MKVGFDLDESTQHRIQANYAIMSAPLVTFVLFGYNQDKFIREALVGAFSQTYSPLEIILSDDCSTDRTFEIMREMAEAYNGNHRVILNRGQLNLGKSAFLDSIVKLAKGEWIVIADGDDISLPDRVKEHMAVADAHQDVFSSFLAPLPFGDPAQGRVPLVTDKVFRYPESLKASGGGLLGATQAFRPSVWNVFGELGAGLIAEDWVIPFRSSILGSVVWSDRPGVRYRVHRNSITASYWGTPGRRAIRRKQVQFESNALVVFERDLRTAVKSKLLSSVEGELGLSWLNQALTTNKMILNCVESTNFHAWLFSAMCIVFSRRFVGSYGRRLDILRRTYSKTLRDASFE